MIQARVTFMFKDAKVENKVIEGLFDSEIELKIILQDLIKKSETEVKHVQLNKLKKVG
jgi:hypothetical protein